MSNIDYQMIDHFCFFFALVSELLTPEWCFCGICISLLGSAAAAYLVSYICCKPLSSA